MPEYLSYRKQVLHAVDAFLQGTPASLSQGQQIIEQCSTALGADSQRFTLDGLIWRSFVHPLTDSVFFTSREYLLELRSALLGFPIKARNKILVKQDFRPYLTPIEAEWYAQLLSTLDFIQRLPFAQVAEAAAEARQNHAPGMTILETIPEAMPIRQAHQDYAQRKAAIEALAASIPPPKQFGEETLYRLVLREVSALVTAIDIRLSAVYKGYPSPLPPYVVEGDKASEADISDPLAWAKRALAALAGDGTFFFSWQLVSAPSFDTDLLLISFH
jgi:hypothetical protein